MQWISKGNILIVGLGLMGGSYARALSRLGYHVAAVDTREQAIKRMNWALSEFVVEGVSTNIDFQLKLIGTQAFRSGEYDNGYLNRTPLI